MNTKKYLAAAVALSGGLACAQSSVQIYGIVDNGLVYIDKVRSGGVGSPYGHALRLDSGNATASRLGFRGREDLGGGLRAIFVLEQGINTDVGTLGQGGRAFGRASYVALGGGMGEIQLGREVTPLFQFGSNYDPVAPSRFAAPIFDMAYVGRSDNAIKYLGKFGGLSMSAQYSFGFDSSIANGGELPSPNARVGKQAGVQADYKIGDLSLGAAYDRRNGTAVATKNDTDRHVAIGATYTFVSVKLFAAATRQTVRVGATSTSKKFSWVGAQYSPVANIALTGAVYVYDPAGASNRSVMSSLMAFYEFSKKSDLYLAYSHLSNQSAASRGMVGVVNPGDGQNGMTLGIRHRF